MGLSESLRQKIAEAVAANRVATREDLLEDTVQAVTLTPDYEGYFNVRVTSMLDGMVPYVVTHLKFIPVKEEGVVTVQPAHADETGAVSFDRSETGRSGTANMRVAVRRMKLDWTEDRKRILPVTPDLIDLPTGEQVKVLVLTVKGAEQVKREKRPRKAKATPPAPGADKIASSDQSE